MRLWLSTHGEMLTQCIRLDGMQIRRRSPTHPDQQQVQTILFSTLHPPPSTLHPNPIPGIWHRRHAAQQSFLEAHLSHTALAFVSQAVSEDDSVGLPLFKFIHSVCAKGGEPSLVVLPVRFSHLSFFFNLHFLVFWFTQADVRKNSHAMQKAFCFLGDCS